MCPYTFVNLLLFFVSATGDVLLPPSSPSDDDTTTLHIPKTTAATPTFNTVSSLLTFVSEQFSFPSASPASSEASPLSLSVDSSHNHKKEHSSKRKAPPAAAEPGSFDSSHTSWSTGFLQVAHCDSQHFAETVSSWARWFLGPDLLVPEPHYEHQFFHGPVHGDLPPPKHCAASEDWCRVLVSSEAQLKGLGEHITTLIRTPELDGAMATSELGVAPLLRSLTRPPNESMAMSMGGGSGAGFQVLCGDTTLLSAGGGGGGGFDGAPGKHHVKSGDLSSWSIKSSFGAGGGAGVQILRDPTDPKSGWISVGGGNGCGSDSRDPELRCGSSTDGDMDEVSFATQRDNLVNTLRTCAQQGKLVIIGGGGGGGGAGTGEVSGDRARSGCCNFGIGYGFRFSLSYGAADPQPHFKGRSEESALVAQAFKDAAHKCGGYQNWKCVCPLVKHKAGSAAHLQCAHGEDSGKTLKKLKNTDKDKENRKDQNSHTSARKQKLADEKSKETKSKSNDFTSEFSSNTNALLAGPGPCNWLPARTHEDGFCHLNSTRYTTFLSYGCSPSQWRPADATLAWNVDQITGLNSWHTKHVSIFGVVAMLLCVAFAVFLFVRCIRYETKDPSELSALLPR